MISKYTKYIKIKEDVYAIFNSLLMKVFYMNEKELKELLNGSIIDTELTLHRAGILVKNQEVDKLAYETLKTQLSSKTAKIEIMYMIMSSACNLRCKYCFVENNQDNNHCEINMSEKVAEEAINKFSKYVLENDIEYPLIVFYGGEPLVNWGVLRHAIEYAEHKIKKIRFNMVSNGTLFNEGIASYLAEHRVEIGISIDGHQELNDTNRVYRNSSRSVYTDVMSTLDMFDHNSMKCGLSITVSKQLLENQDIVLQWLKDCDRKNIFFNLYHFTSKEEWREYYEKACAFLIKAYEFLAPNGIVDGRIVRKIDSFTNEVFKFADCAANGGNQITIKPNGKVCVCQGYLKTDQYELGSVWDLDFCELKQSKELEFWINRIPLCREECIDCEALFICGGGCALQAEALFGNRDELDLPFCMHSKQTLLWLLRKGYDVYSSKV